MLPLSFGFFDTITTRTPESGLNSPRLRPKVPISAAAAAPRRAI